MFAYTLLITCLSSVAVVVDVTQVSFFVVSPLPLNMVSIFPLSTTIRLVGNQVLWFASLFHCCCFFFLFSFRSPSTDEFRTREHDERTCVDYYSSLIT